MVLNKVHIITKYVFQEFFKWLLCWDIEFLNKILNYKIEKNHEKMDKLKGFENILRLDFL